MRWAAGIAAFAAVCLAAGCSGSSGNAPSSDPPHFVPSTPVTSSSAPSTSTSTPTAPATPSVPADVPTTGPNVTGPSERPPVEPILATQRSAAGAKAFAEFFIRTIDWAYATNSTKYMRHYYEASCVACASTADAVDRAAQKGHHFVGDRFSIRRVTAPAPSGTGYRVAVFFDVSAAEVVDHAGHFVDGLGALTNYEEQIVVKWRPSGWMVREMTPKGVQ